MGAAAREREGRNYLERRYEMACRIEAQQERLLDLADAFLRVRQRDPATARIARAHGGGLAMTSRSKAHKGSLIATVDRATLKLRRENPGRWARYRWINPAYWPSEITLQGKNE